MLSIVEQFKEDIKVLRGAVEKSLVDEVTTVKVDEIHRMVDITDIMVFIKIKDELEIHTVGGGFVFTGEGNALKGKLLHVRQVVTRDRTEDDVRRGGRLGRVYGFKCNSNIDGVVKEHTVTIDDEFISEVIVISFKDKPFEDRMEDVNKLLIECSNDNEEELTGLKGDYERKQGTITETRTKLTRYLKDLDLLNLKILELEKRDNGKGYMTDLEMLKSHKLFKNLSVIDGHLVFTTDYINIYDPSNMENVFAGNKFEIKVRMRDCKISFKGLDRSRCHKSYWTENDPHPHVSGRASGDACLGNVNTTLAELCSSNEIYALFTVLVNFLQTFNIEDTAGRNIRNWDMVDGSQNPYNNTRKCGVCGERIGEDDDFYTCDDCGMVLCEDHAHWHDGEDEYYCETHYNARTFECAECNTRYEDEDDINRCTECNTILCTTHTHWDKDGDAYCEQHLPETEEEEDTVDEEVSVPVIAPPLVGAKCDDCHRTLAMGESISWVENTGTLLELCEECMKIRESTL